MKKKRNFLTIISSILGIFAICGFSMFSILDYKKNQDRVDAVNTILIFSESKYFDTSVSTLQGGVVNVEGNYFLKYYKIYENDSYYFQFDTDISWSYYWDYNGHRNRVKANESNSSFNLRVLSNRFDFAFHSGDVYKLYFNTGFTDDVGQIVTHSISALVNQLMYYDGEDLTLNQFLYESDAYTYRDGSLNQNILTDIYDFSLQMVSSFSLSIYLDDYESGYLVGYDDGYNEGYLVGSNDSYPSGYQVGYEAGLQQGESNSNSMYTQGYSAGYNAGLVADGTAMTIISGIFQVALVPINFFLGIFNFEVLGINFSSLVQALFTIAITIIILKSILGKKGD